MPELAYVNGVFCDLKDARVSVEDRGFQFADGVYEVIIAVGKKPLRLRQHLERLKRSSDAIELPIDYDTLDLPGIIREGIERSGFSDCTIYVQITRGVVSRSHLYPEDITPTVVATFKAKSVDDRALHECGVSLETARDIRWARCSIKSIALLPNVLLKNAARRRGRFEAVIVGPDDTVLEATSANVFIVSRSVLRTPPCDERILEGVTRAYVLECARDIGIACDETQFKTADMLAADEVFISSTAIDIMPVVTIDDHPIGSGRPGELTQRLMKRFYEGMGRQCALKREPCSSS